GRPGLQPRQCGMRGRLERLDDLAVALREPDGAHGQARLETVGDELGRAAAYVDDESPRRRLAEPAPHEIGLLVAREQAGDEAVAPLDLAEERLAVLGIAHRARGDEQRALGAERL